nr:hypothetical protein [Synechococcus sp. GFB01]
MTWVDGNDPKLNRKRDQFWKQQRQSSKLRSTLRGSTRYANNNEILYCLASILINAAFVRRIHVITDQQRPQLEALSELGCSASELNKISIVDHAEIFGDLIDLAPTFNSRSIESLIHRTPDLADHFLYMNDDFFILRPTLPSDFFAAPGVPRPLARLRPYSRSAHRAKLKLLDIASHFRKVRPGFNDANRTAALTANLRHEFLSIEHAPYPLYRPVIEDFFARNPGLLRRNASYRFRHHRQFLVQALAWCIGLKQGRLVPCGSGKTVCHVKADALSALIKHHAAGLDIFQALPKIDSDCEQPRFLCIQSLDKATRSEQEQLLAILRETLLRSRRGAPQQHA